MGREIRFRGKRVDNGEWVYGYYVGAVATCNTPRMFLDCGISVLVIPESVGQFTGLTDKNEVEIYEGDIIEHKYKDEETREKKSVKCLIEWKFLSAGDDADSDSYGYHINPNWFGYYKVIGNRHDNPEMLE